MTHHPPLVLASTSPYRIELLRRLGLSFQSHAHAFDEDILKGVGLPPDQLAARLAEAKARSIADHFPGCLILGSDQVAEVDGRILDKPGTAERAIEQLELLQGRTHRLITATCLLLPDRTTRALLDTHTLRMRHLSRAQIEAYVQRDQPLDCCGSYKIEQRGIALFEAIEGEDFTAIMGLPLMALTRTLNRVGFDVLLADP